MVLEYLESLLELLFGLTDVLGHVPESDQLSLDLLNKHGELGDLDLSLNTSLFAGEIREGLLQPIDNVRIGKGRHVI